MNGRTEKLKDGKTNPISVCIICFNEQDNISRCLESVKWVKDKGGEIVVVDSFSADKTLEIVREYTDRVFQNKWPGFVNQKNYALSLAQNEWILSIDADEVISDRLRDEIINTFYPSKADVSTESLAKVDGYWMKRHTFYLGRWINHGGWYPDSKIRLFRKSKAKWGGLDPHDRIIMENDARVGNLNGDIIHYTYKNISHQIKTVDRFSDASSEALMKEGKTFCLCNLLFRPPIKFIETYLFKLGFLDGLPGLIISVSSAYYVFVKYAKMWEKQRKT
ncbi:MAG: glycosyltransferase family 2 protein [Planctomycetota bacterium]